MLDADAFYSALRTRDSRFDGRFFVGVRSTGVYCRPVCPARTPLRRNCTFYGSAAAAQEAGYRPCLRCRPEAAPGSPAWEGSHATVTRGLRLIADGALDRGSVSGLAERLGVGERQLRRLFMKHLGASPVAVAQNRRVLFAKKLLDETDLSMTAVACAAGFGSVRRFNDAMQQAYRRPPAALRRAVSEPCPAGEIELRLAYRPPLDWQGLLRFFARRAIRGVEEVSGGAYRRSVALGDARGHIEVRKIAGEDRLRARIALDASAPLSVLAERIRRTFDLSADPCAVAEHLARDPALAARIAAHPGLRIPGAFDPFEVVVRAILGQQVSVAGATTLIGRLVERYGERVDPADFAPGLTRIFPRPDALLGVDLRAIGLPAARALALAGAAQAVAEGALQLDGARDLAETIGQLQALPGIGDWTAQYVALRALQAPDAFPASDLGLRRALCEPCARAPSARQVAERAEAALARVRRAAALDRGVARILCARCASSADASSRLPGSRRSSRRGPKRDPGPAPPGPASRVPARSRSTRRRVLQGSNSGPARARCRGRASCAIRPPGPSAWRASPITS
jgi:AraC family transcriptional regulator of adaptative response / DNA-3-methyladenine glycosylase II